MDRRQLYLTVAGGAGLLGLAAFLLRGGGSATAEEVAVAYSRTFDAAGREAFVAAVDRRTEPYAEIILDVAARLGLNPFTIVGLMLRESGSSLYLSPRTAAGVGDPTPRWFAKDSVPQWANDYALVSGRTRIKDGVEQYEVVPPAAGGAEDAGWGYGLMQIDWVSHRPFIESGAWKDPAKNIEYGARVLLEAINYFKSSPGRIQSYRGETIGPETSDATYTDPRPLTGDLLTRAALAAYNAGTVRVLWAIARGKDPDSVTTKGSSGSPDYGTDVRDRALALVSKFHSVLPSADAGQIVT